MEEKNLIKMENFLTYEDDIDTNDHTFEKLMFIYSIAIKEIENKLEILKDEFKIFYDYDLIDHINTRIKEPKSIIKKLKNKQCELTYRQMIENVNDIAGIRVICPLKKDVFSIKNLIESFPGVEIVKEKDYITHPKKSGYMSYHIILDVPVNLSQKQLYVRVEIQIRTVTMDFWAELEHKLKYKPKEQINKKNSKELLNCAKMVSKLDNKMELLNE